MTFFSPFFTHFGTTTAAVAVVSLGDLCRQQPTPNLKKKEKQNRLKRNVAFFSGALFFSSSRNSSVSTELVFLAAVEVVVEVVVSLHDLCW